MKLISVDSLKSGERLSTPIRKQDGCILLPSNALVTTAYVQRLKSFGIEVVYISDELFDDVIVKPCLSDETKTEALQAVKDTFIQLKSNKPFNDAPLKRATKALVNDVRTSMHTPISLFNTYAVEDSLCLHAVNVATIVAAMAFESGCNMIMVEEYALAGMLHDIKLESVGQDNKANHTEDAYSFLKSTYMFSNRTIMGVAMHHEKFDGTGFPKKLKAEAITEGARMIAIADMYDNLIYGYGVPKMNMNHAVEFLNMEAYKSLDPNYLRYFNSSVAIYPTGSTVRLNSGDEAIVIEQNEKMPSRPKLRLRRDLREECLQINLLTQRTMFIEELLL